MRHKRITIIGLLFSVIIYTSSAQSGTNADICSDKEDFEVFFEKFCFDKNFQLSRIKFPLYTIRLNEDTYDNDTIYLKKGDWNYTRFDYFPDKDARSQIYDSFEMKMEDSNERVFVWKGIGNGINDFYYFKRMHGCWYLIKEEDFSI